MRKHISLMAKHIRTYNCTLISKTKGTKRFLSPQAPRLGLLRFPPADIRLFLKDQPYGVVN